MTDDMLERDGEAALDRAVATTLDAAVEMDRIRLEARERLRRELREAFARNVGDMRAQIIEESTQKMQETLDRQLGLYVQVEEELVLRITRIVHSWHERALDRLNMSNIRLSHALNLIEIRVESSNIIDTNERNVDILLAIMAIFSALYFIIHRIFPTNSSIWWDFVVPSFYLVIVLAVIVYKLRLHQARASELLKLRDFVADQVEEAKASNPVRDEGH